MEVPAVDPTRAPLARINLLRVRGHYDQAKAEACELLQHYPKDAATLLLMGVVFHDSGERDAAAKWYELALDADPALAEARRRYDALAPLPPAPPRPDSRRIAVMIAGIAVAIFTLAMVAERRSGDPVLPRLTIGGRVEAPASPSVAIAPPPVEPSKVMREAVVPPSVAAPMGGDVTLLGRLTSGSGPRSRITMVQEDPRTGALTITLALRETDAPRSVAAESARMAFATLEKTDTVILRGMRGETLAYVGDATRERFLKIEADASPESVADTLLLNEWPRVEAVARDAAP